MKNESGFGLLSVLVAMTIFGAGVLALARTGAEVVRVHSSASTRSVAVALARSYMETIRGQDPKDLASESPVKLNREGIPDASGLFTREVKVEDVGTNLKQVTVVVQYPRALQPVELVTLAFYTTGGGF